MVRKLTTGVLFASGLWLVAIGIQRWSDNREVAQVVTSFVDAVKRGDKDRILDSLDPRLRALNERGEAEQLKPLIDGKLQFEYQIHHIEISRDRAKAELRINKDGFMIKPVVYLQRSPTTVWKVNALEHIEVDPRWNDLQQARSLTRGEKLAEELGDSLNGIPGASVQRITMQDQQD